MTVGHGNDWGKENDWMYGVRNMKKKKKRLKVEFKTNMKRARKLISKKPTHTGDKSFINY